MEVLGYVDWMTGWGISFARKFKLLGGDGALSNRKARSCEDRASRCASLRS